MGPAETNRLLLERMEKFEILASGSARAIGGAAKARRLDGQEPVQFIGSLVRFLLSEEGSRHLTEAAEKATKRGGGLQVARTLLAPLLARGSDVGIDRQFGEWEERGPEGAASALARGLLYERDNRDLVSADFRPELPAAEVRVREVLGELHKQGTRFATNLDELAREWSSIGTRPKREIASALCVRLANHESHRLAAGSEAPAFDPRDPAWSENGQRREELAQSPVYSSMGGGEGRRQETEEFDPRSDLMRNPVYSSM